MTSASLWILIAAAAGVAVALQGQFMASLNRAAGTAGSVFITYAAGAVIAAIFWFARSRPLPRPGEVPWYSWSAGALGLIIVGGIGYAAPRLGLSRTLVVTVAAQLAAAILIDHFGWFGADTRPVDARSALGLAVTVAGVWITVSE